MEFLGDDTTAPGDVAFDRVGRTLPYLTSVQVDAGETWMRITIEDRGLGIRDAEDGDPHFGLSMMRVRAEDIEGTLEIGSTPGGGTRVVALLPVGGRGEER